MLVDDRSWFSVCGAGDCWVISLFSFVSVSWSKGQQRSTDEAKVSKGQQMKQRSTHLSLAKMYWKQCSCAQWTVLHTVIILLMYLLLVKRLVVGCIGSDAVLVYELIDEASSFHHLARLLWGSRSVYRLSLTLLPVLHDWPNLRPHVGRLRSIHSAAFAH